MEDCAGYGQDGPPKLTPDAQAGSIYAFTVEHSLGACLARSKDVGTLHISWPKRPELGIMIRQRGESQVRGLDMNA